MGRLRAYLRHYRAVPEEANDFRDACGTDSRSCKWNEIALEVGLGEKVFQQWTMVLQQIQNSEETHIWIFRNR